MLRRGLAVPSLLVGLAVCTLPACHTRTVSSDGGPDAGSGDAATSDAPGALALDIAATGCGPADAGAPLADGGAAACTGTAPLTLTFTPVSSPALTRFRWTFGDDSPPSSERAPTHTYVLPGIYEVDVVAAGDNVGSVSRTRPGFVAVAASVAGSPCDVDAQCATGLLCLCGESAPCGDGFPHGICTSSCAAGACGGGAACARVDVPPRTAAVAADAGAVTDGALDDAVTFSVDVGDALDAPVGDAADAPASDAPGDARGDAPVSDAASDAPAESAADAGAALDANPPSDAGASSTDAGRAPPAPYCLATCAVDGDCATGLVCRPLPGFAAGSWANVCVPPLYRPVADSCRDAEGHLDDHVCSTGLCADLGAIGLCSASCAAGAACPTGTACGTFGDGRALCLLTCVAGSCEKDPLLACESGAGKGLLDFTIFPPAPTATFCAPRSCTSAADCAPSGTCSPLGVGAHCVPN